MKIDRQLVNKQIVATKLKLKVIIASAVLLIAVVAWFVIQYLLPQPETIDQEILDLATPFSFQINERVFELIADKVEFTPEELASFPIYIADEASLNRGNSLVVNQLGADNLSPTTELPPVMEITIDEEAFLEYNDQILEEVDVPAETLDAPALDQGTLIY